MDDFWEDVGCVFSAGILALIGFAGIGCCVYVARFVYCWLVTMFG